jgi:hypothetical protein
VSDTLVGKATQILKAEAPRLAPIPAERLAEKIGSTILGLFIALIGLGVVAIAGYIMILAKEVKLYPLFLAGGGLIVLFIGGVTASKDVLVSLTNIATLAKTVLAMIRKTPEPPAP